jgi:hypothetical protein
MLDNLSESIFSKSRTKRKKYSNFQNRKFILKIIELKSKKNNNIFHYLYMIYNEDFECLEQRTFVSHFASRNPGKRSKLVLGHV